MVTVNPKLFKKYDIRGTAMGKDAPLTPEVARLIGQAFGTYLRNVEERRTVVVGRDNRHSSTALMDAAMHGLSQAGCHVVDIALTSTPVVYWNAVKRNNAGGMMVTGSHLPPDQNGFKLSVGARNLYGDGIQEILRLIQTGAFTTGTGEIDCIESVEDYYSDIVPKLRIKTRPLKIVVDAGNGTGGIFAPKLLRTLGHTVIELFCEPDGSYPNHQPDPQVPENLRLLGEKVREVGADLGLAFDGDADRMGAVDEQGNGIAADRLLALLARDMLARHPGATVVGDVLSSQVLFDAVAQAGGTPIMWASGHSLVKAKMVETGALLGGEMSGHIFLGEDYYGFDDAYVAVGRLLQVLATSKQSLSALNASLPTLYSTPEYRPHCPDEAKARVIDGVRAALDGKGGIVAVDGIRVQFEHGWGLLRASNTEPVLSLRFEATSEVDALAYRDLFVAALKNYPEVEAII